MEAKLERRGDGGFQVAGDMTFATTPALLETSRALFRDGRELRLDLTGVEHADSAGLALLFEWLAQARRQGSSLSIRGLPESLLSLARLCQLDGELAKLAENPAR